MKEDYRVQQFKNGFSDTRVPMLIYGTGKGTQILLPNITEYNIVGILDRRLTSGQMCNVPIMDEEKAVATGAHKLIIVAMASNVIKIYRRIRGFCEQNQITAHDINGNDLSSLCGKYEIDIPYFKKSWAQLYSETEKYDVISFDIFDTLLVRKVLEPTAIFDIVEQQLKNTELQTLPFKKLRIDADNNLSHKGLRANIYEIYDELADLSGIDKSQMEYLIRLEFETECKFIEARKSMRNFYNSLKDKKRIYLVSNMHLPQEMMESILKKCGYTGYSEVLISCEYRKGKQDGLFDVLKQHAMVKGEKILHIGDSQELDGIVAQKAGLNVFPVFSKYDLLLNSSYYEIADYAVTPLDQVLIGTFAEYAFDDPFILYKKKGRLKVDSIDQYVNMFLSPLVLYYSFWIAFHVIKRKYDYILYTSRDGYLLEQVVKELAEKNEWDDFPKGQYFYTSRRAASAAGVFDKADIMELASRSFYGNIGQLFKIRFDIDVSEELYDLEVDNRNIELVIENYSDEILEKCSSERDNYWKYINKYGLSSYKHIAVVEQCGVGNVQRGLARLLSNVQLHGIFLKKSMDDKLPIDYISFFPTGEEWRILNNLSLANMEFEQFLSSPEPSVKCFDKQGNPVFLDEVRSEKQLNTLRYMQEYAKKYCSEMSDLCCGICPNEPNWKVINCMLGFLDEKYTDIEVEDLNKMIVEDNFGQGASVSVKDMA